MLGGVSLVILISFCVLVVGCCLLLYGIVNIFVNVWVCASTLYVGIQYMQLIQFYECRDRFKQESLL